MAIEVIVDGLDTSLNVTLDGLDTATELEMEELVVVESPPYEGDYEVVSHPFNEQEYPTIGKRMTENLKVKKIPYAETPNEYGTTISISS